MLYLDYAATTPTDPRIAERVLELMVHEFGNAGSRTHAFGLDAKREVDAAREKVARLLGAEANEVVFTSGATESNNIAILGLETHGRATGRQHLVSTAIEHHAVLGPLRWLEERGFELTLVGPDERGHVSADAVAASVRSDTLLVSVMHANNETGAVQPINELAAKMPPEPFLHVDAAQTAAWRFEELGTARIDLVSISGHKMYAPKGIGALLSRRRDKGRVPLQPLQVGGGQEGGLRPGTLPVPLIAGLGMGCELAVRERDARLRQTRAQRDAALRAFSDVDAVIHGDPNRGILPHVLSVALPGLDSEALMVALRSDAAVANGSACTSASYESSHVLQAMMLPPDVTNSTVRFSWGADTPMVDWSRLVGQLDDLRL